jgi:O-methyltransferase involved in polyketide biosynthesis
MERGEGLRSFLPPEAQDRLLDTVTEPSPAGSRFATENVPNVGVVTLTMAAPSRAG